ncbi:unnamed protein product, partial [Phaeothamnion confervicola]
ATDSASCGVEDSSTPCCTECYGLQYCSALTGFEVEDKYMPSVASSQGSCWDFDERAQRLEVFGPERTFRDTDTCRALVYEYSCLWWGSDNDAFINRCTNSPPVPPCRSFCVELAETCANNVEQYKTLCEDIDCPP